MTKTILTAVLASAIVGGVAGYGAASLSMPKDGIPRPKIAIVDFVQLLEMKDEKEMEAAADRLKDRITALESDGWIVLNRTALVSRPPEALTVPID